MQQCSSQEVFQILINKWLRQSEENDDVDQIREIQQKLLEATSFKSRQIQEISQKLNRLERNFLREKEVKKQTKEVENANDGILQLDELYQQANKLITAIKQKNKEENREIMSQIIRLYNHSAVQLTKQQKIQKEIKLKKMKLGSLQNKLQIVKEETKNIEQSFMSEQARHWLNMKTFQKISGLR